MIEIHGLSKSFGEVQALGNVSLMVQTGSVFGLIGSNGAGKSTLLRLMAGIYSPQEGEVLTDGAAPYENEEVKARIRFLPDEPYFPGQKSLLKMGEDLKRIYPGWDQEYFERLTQIFPVNEKARYHSLSKGNRRQAAVILALSTRPDILLLDEVFDGLDPVVRRLLKKVLFDEVTERRMTVVLASHNLREMEDFCDTLALLHKGGVVLEQELDDMKLCLQRVQAVFSEVPKIEALKEKLCITSWEQTGSVLTFVARGNEEEVLKALDSFSPTFRETVPLSLEEVFISEMEAAGYDIDKII